MSGFLHATLHRLGRGCAARPRTVIAAWLVLTAGLVTAVALNGRPTDNDVTLPGSDAQVARDLLERADPGARNANAQLVVHVTDGRLDDPANVSALAEATERIRHVDHVVQATPPSAQRRSLSADGRTGYVSISFDTVPRNLDRPVADAVVDAAAPARAAGIDTVPGGALATAADRTGSRTSELLGLAVAAVVLLFAFGGLVAAALPIATALCTVAGALCTIGLAGHATSIPSVAATLATMVGLGVGLDYALFLVTRHRRQLADGLPVPEAIAASVASSGGAVLFAGGTVVIALGGLAVAGVPLLSTLAWTTGVAVLFAVAGAITLLPALLSLLGTRIDALRVLRRPTPGADDRSTAARADDRSTAARADDRSTAARADDRSLAAGASKRSTAARADERSTAARADERSTAARADERGLAVGVGDRSGWGRLAGAVSRHPWRWALLTAVVLGVLAVPAVDLTPGQIDAGSNPAGSASRRSFDLLAEGFGPGVNGQLTVVLPLNPPATDAADPRLAELTRVVTAVPGVATATPATLPGATLPGATLPSTTLPSTTLPSTTLPSTTLPSTTLPSTTLPGATSKASGEAPSTGGASPSAGGATPSASRTATSAGGTASSAAPSAGIAAPSASRAASSAGGAAPSAAGAAPSAAGTVPSAAGTVPSAVGAVPGAASAGPGASPGPVSSAGAGQPASAFAGSVASVRVTPQTAPGDPRTADLVRALRALEVAGATPHVAGAIPTRVDLADRLATRLPAVIGVVVALSALLLLLAFRAPVVALKAAVMNLVSIGAAYGALTAVFSWGWGVRLVGLDGPVPIESYVPTMLFALLFGLSMDYEVFLLTAVQESWHRTGDNTASVRAGLASTGRVITSAALIMVVVFASFTLHTDPVIKMFGLGMAVAIAVDATIVRGLLVPATMTLLGPANWWLPGRRRPSPATEPQHEMPAA